MLNSRFPLIGVKGMYFMARRLKKWPQRLGQERADLHLGHVVRMQEEIGTGGGGFRFMYAAFLQECGREFQDGVLADCADLLTEVGDGWRRFAVMAARICKKRVRQGDSYEIMADIIMECGRTEEKVFTRLTEWLAEKGERD